MRAGKTEWAHALAGGLSVWGAEGSLGQRPNVPEAGILNEKRINTIYGLDIHYYRSAAAGGGAAVL